MTTSETKSTPESTPTPAPQADMSVAVGIMVAHLAGLMGQVPPKGKIADKAKEIGFCITYSHEWEEWRVCLWEDRFKREACYFTSDMTDAWDTGIRMVIDHKQEVLMKAVVTTPTA